MIDVAIEKHLRINILKLSGAYYFKHLGIFIKIRPKKTSKIILKKAITMKLFRKEVFLVLCLKIIIAAIEPSIPKTKVVAKSAFSGILKTPNLANNLSIP